MKKYELQYFNLKEGSGILAEPTYSHSEFVRTIDPEKLKKYIETKREEYGHFYIENISHGYDYISNCGGVKVFEYKPVEEITFKAL